MIDDMTKQELLALVKRLVEESPPAFGFIKMSQKNWETLCKPARLYGRTVIVAGPGWPDDRIYAVAERE